MQIQNALMSVVGSLGALVCLMSGCNHAVATDVEDYSYPDTGTDSVTDDEWESDSNSDTDSATETDSTEDVDSDSETETSEILYESGIFDPEQDDFGGPAFSATQYLASRFTVTSPVRVIKIGGRMNIFGYSPGTLFSAILRTDGYFPVGSPWLEEEMVAETLFDESMNLPIGITTDQWIPMDVELDPGNYALVFGCHSTNCNGYMSEQTQDTPAGKDSYIKWNSTNSWFNSNSDLRFVVEGQYL